MALYAKDVTQSIEPAQANVGTLAKGIEAKAEGARLSANATGAMLKAAGFLAEQYVAYDVGKTQAEAEQVTSEFLDSGMRAEKAAQDVPLVTAERDKIAATGTSYSLQADAGMRKQAALGTYDQEIKRLKDAAAGGMSNEEYVSRVSALTRKAIAKYPGLADSIREKVGTITGLPYADRWAEMQYVRERFTRETKKDTEFDPMKVVLKDIEAASAPGTFGSQKELFDLYNTNRPEYDRRIMAFNQNKAMKTGVDAVTTQVRGLQEQSDLNADQVRSSFVAMFQGNLGVNVTSASVSTLENIYKPVLALMAKGENVNVNPAAFDTQIKMHNAQMKTNIEQARVASINEIDKYIANNPNITSGKRDQLKKDINDAADLQLRMYADDKGVGLAAMSTIMSNYRDKSIKEQRDLINLAIQQQAAMQNNSLVMAYWAGGEQRKNLELTNKDFYNFMVKQEKILLDNTNGITSNLAGTDALRETAAVVKAAGENPAAVATPTDVAPESVKAAHAVIQSSANTSLDKVTQNKVLSAVERTVISSALSTNVESGANSQILANDYKKMGAKIKLLPAEDQAIIKDNVSKAARNNVMAMSSLKEGLENKYGVTLMLGVTPTGQIVAMPTPLTKEEQAKQKALGLTKIPLNDVRRKEPAAIDEFNKQSKALLSNLVFGRVMLTEEDPVAVANEFATIMNNRQPYNGFYSNAPVAPSPTTDFTGAAPIPANALANQEAMRIAEEKANMQPAAPVTSNVPTSKREASGKLIDESKRPDGTSKGTGYLGILKASNGSDVTEYSVSSADVKVNGKEIDFPTIVPTLTKAEVNLMLTDIIPNNKRIPDAIYKKAVDHAKKRIKEGKNVFAETGDYKPATSNTTPSTSTTEKWWRK